jgi:hypothetical protein
MEEENKLSPELSDIIEMIKRYAGANKNNVTFVYSFIGFRKDPTHKCEDCGDDCSIIGEDISTMGAYGDIYTCRALLNDLRDIVEENQDEDGFVNC